VAQLGLRFALGAVVVTLLGTPSALDAQGLVKAFNKARKPATRPPDRSVAYWRRIGRVVGVFTGVLGVGQQNGQAPPRRTIPNRAAPQDSQGRQGRQGNQAGGV